MADTPESQAALSTSTSTPVDKDGSKSKTPYLVLQSLGYYHNVSLISLYPSERHWKCANHQEANLDRGSQQNSQLDPEIHPQVP